MTKISEPMYKAMRNLAAGRHIGYGIHDRSASGGLMGTIMALHRRGLLDGAGNLSATGREAVAPTMPHTIILTVADHEKNGFVNIARMLYPNEACARKIIEAVDAKIDDDSEPDQDDASFWFILDLHLGDRDDQCTDTSRRRLPTQIARQIAPALVDAWLQERPDPDSVAQSPIPRIHAIDGDTF